MTKNCDDCDPFAPKYLTLNPPKDVENHPRMPDAISPECPTPPYPSGVPLFVPKGGRGRPKNPAPPPFGCFKTPKKNEDPLSPVKWFYPLDPQKVLELHRRQVDWWLFRPCVPGNWMENLLKLPVAAIRTGLALWQQATVRSNPCDIILKPPVQKKFWLKGKTYAEGLTALEKADLVAARRHPGHPPRTTLVSYFHHRKGRTYRETKERMSEFSWTFQPCISGNWMKDLMYLPKSAIKAGLAVQHQALLRRDRYDPSDVVITKKTKKAFGIGSAKALDRGLAKLEEAMLVDVLRHRGKSPRVTILRYFSKNSPRGRRLYLDGIRVVGRCWSGGQPEWILGLLYDEDGKPVPYKDYQEYHTNRRIFYPEPKRDYGFVLDWEERNQPASWFQETPGVAEAICGPPIPQAVKGRSRT